LALPADAPVEIVAYDAAWPRRFDEEARLLRELLRPWLAGPIEHIGSTAVPGLAAKPIVDILAAVESLDASRPSIAALAAAGYGREAALHRASHGAGIAAAVVDYELLHRGNRRSM
jgi:GrpB-like predicted nucleotidyltransferase (UPF0157 family)